MTFNEFWLDLGRYLMACRAYAQYRRRRDGFYEYVDSEDMPF